jgi:undecaprenyl-diphosphatase
MLRYEAMARVLVRPTVLDRKIAKAIANRATPGFERCCKIITLAADERYLVPLATALWIFARATHRSPQRRVDHVALGVVVTAILPHLLKRVFAQERPDRCVTPRRHHHNRVPKSGKAYDAFPSGHAMHIGFLAAAFSRFFPQRRLGAWTVGGILATTRIALLAHWTSDVVLGLASGAAVERMLGCCPGAMRIPGGGKNRMLVVDGTPGHRGRASLQELRTRIKR